MCRLAAYLGEKIPLADLINKPHYNLYEQSWQAREMSYGKVNADGFGFGWYDRHGKAGIYRKASPIWADDNLPDLSRAWQASLWLAMVRSATAGSAYDHRAAQPFRYRHFLFMHNGFINNMGSVRKKLVAELSVESAELVAGVSDSEYLFALFCEHLKKTEKIDVALRRTLLWCLDHFSSDNVGMLNIVVSDGQQLCASRFAIREKEPTLYVNHKGESGFPDNSLLLASERFSENDHWQLVPAATLVSLRPGQEPVFRSL